MSTDSSTQWPYADGSIAGTIFCTVTPGGVIDAHDLALADALSDWFVVPSNKKPSRN
jgi:hypothetical protein